MNWRRFIPSGKQVADAATSKAAQAAAGAVVDRFGPHRTLSKIGTVMILIGIVVLALAWFFLTSWSYWLVTVFGVGLVGLGYAFRGFNSLVVSLLARFLKAVGRRIYNFGNRQVQKYRERRAAKLRRQTVAAGTPGNITTPGADSPRGTGSGTAPDAGTKAPPVQGCAVPDDTE